MIHYGGFIYISFQITADADLELGVSKDWKKWKQSINAHFQVNNNLFFIFEWNFRFFCITNCLFIDFTQFLGEWLTSECVLFDSLRFLKLFDRLMGLFVSIIQHNFDLKKIEAIPPIVYNEGYLHKKVRGKTSSLVALYHYMCLYTRNSWEMEAIFNTVLFKETEH